MKKLLTAIYVLGGISLLAVGAKAQSNAPANLLVAGDFESITSANLTGYSAPTTGVWGSESAAISGAANGITPFGTKMLQLNHAGGGTAAQTNQIVYGPFKAGSVVTFAAKFNTWRAADSSSPQTVAVSIMTDSGLALTGTRYTSPTIALDTNLSTWQTASVTVTLPADTNYISAEIMLWMYSGALPVGTPLAYADQAVLTVAPHVNWVNWTGSGTDNGVFKYFGQMVVPRTSGGTTTVNVKYTPPGGIAFFQYTNGTDFFAQGNSGSLGRSPAWSPYTSSKVGNIPDGGGAASDLGDIIALQYAGTNKLEFSDASTGQPIAIASPVFAYVSLNGNGYGFDQDFDILSYDDGTLRDQGYFGAGTSYKSVATVNGATQYQLLGTGEPHGTLQFRGSFSTVSWQSLSNEYWNGFTVGVTSLAADVPIANAGPDQTVTATSPSGAAVQLSGSVSGSQNSPFTYSWTGPFGTVTGQNPTVNLAIGGPYTITLTVTDATGASDTDTVLVTVVTPPAPVINSASTASGVYGSPFSYTITATNSPTSYGATGSIPAGLTVNGAVISGTPTQTGTFSILLTATNLGGTGNKTLTLTIAKANATVVVTPYNVTYDGQSHSATIASITGVNGETGAAVGVVTLNTTHTNAGTYADSWTFADPANHYNSIASTPITDTITKATATVVVTPYSVNYDGHPHSATVASITGVNGESGATVGAVTLNTTHTNAGSYATDSWSFTGAGNYGDIAATTITDTIAKATATVVVTPYSVTYDGQPHSASVASITGVNGETGAAVGTVTLNTTHTNAGTYATDSWSFSGTANYSDIAATTITDTIAKATATVVVTPYNVTYDGQSHSASVASITGVNGETGATVGTVTLNTTHTGAGTYANDSWSLTGGANYNDIAATPVTDTIAKATATIVVTPYSVTYDAQPHSATVGSITGVNGETGASVGTVTLNTTHTNAGTYGGDSWSFTGGANYNDIAATSITDKIAKADATVSVSGYTGVYDFGPHGATGTATGVGGANLGSSLSLGSTFVNVPGGTAHWTFAGGTNYNDQSGDVAVTISKATATITFNATTLTYDGTPRVVTYGVYPVGSTPVVLTYAGASSAPINAGSYALLAVVDDPNFQGQQTGTLTVNPKPVSINGSNFNQVYDGTPKALGITLSDNVAHTVTYTLNGVPVASPVNAGHYKVDVVVTDPNYSGLATLDFTIQRANATVVVTPYNVTFDGNPHSATVTSITGVNGETGATVGTVSLNTTHTGAGTYSSDTWSLIPTANYNGIPNTAITDTISKADATVKVLGYTGVFDGLPHGATGTAKGVGGVDLSGRLNLGVSYVNVPGGPVHWTFTGGQNYNDQSGDVSVNISKADAVFHVSGYTGVYDGVAHGASGTATGAGGVDLSANLNLGATFTNVAGGTANWTFSGGTNYNDASGSAAITITKANATVVVTPYNVELDGYPHTATVASITGVHGESGAVVGSVSLNTTHTAVGTYADSWSFTGGANYNNIGTTAITDQIYDTTPPTITSVTPSTATLWPPNHKMVGITVNAVASDLGGIASLKIISVTSNEPDNGLGDGDTPNDIQITGNLTVNLRAERSGTGTGRVYTITVEARDRSNNASTKTCTVTVPLNQGK